MKKTVEGLESNPDKDSFSSSPVDREERFITPFANSSFVGSPSVVGHYPHLDRNMSKARRCDVLDEKKIEGYSGKKSPNKKSLYQDLLSLQEGYFLYCPTGVSSSATPCEEVEEDLFLDVYTKDQDMIEEQRRLLEQFERTKRAAVPSSDTAGTNRLPVTTIKTRKHEHPSQGSSSSSSASLFSCDDHATRIQNHFVRVKGSRHAYDAIAHGSAVIVQCSGCYAVLQVPSNAKNVFCTVCNHVTPMDLALNVSSQRLNVQDSDIARKIQIQEIDAASSLKAKSLLRGTAP